MSKLSLLTPIIVALIGIIGTLMPSFINNLSSQKDNTPNIEIDVDNIGYEKKIDVSNIGNGPATNMALFIDASPQTISTLTNIISTSDILFNNKSIETGKPIEINNTNVKLRTSNFIHGKGSIISLAVSLEKNGFQTYISPNIIVRSIYDQGSSSNIFQDITVQSPPWVFYYILIYLPVIGYMFYYVAITRKKGYFKKIIESLLAIRHTLKSDFQTEKIFEDVWNTKGITLVDKYYAKIKGGWNLERFRKSMNIRDYILLDDFFTLLGKRNFLLQSNLTDISKREDITLKEINEQILDSINKILIKIQWKKYV